MSDRDSNWYGPDAATFGDRVAGARQVAGLTQEELAERLGVRLDTITAWEEDRDEPRSNKLSMLSGVLNVSLPWLLTGTGGPGVDAPAEEGELALRRLRPLIADLGRLRADLAAAEARVAEMERRLSDLVGEAQS